MPAPAASPSPAPGSTPPTMAWWRRIGGIVALALTLSLVYWTSVDLDRARERELAAAERDAHNLVQMLAAQVSGTVDKVDLQLQDFLDHYRPLIAAHAPRADVEAPLARYLTRIPEARTFRVVDAQGRIVYDAAGNLPPVSVADRDYFRDLQENPVPHLAISGPILSRSYHEWVVVLARRINSPQGDFAGILMAPISVSHLEQRFAPLNIGPSGVVALWTTDFRLISRRPAQPDWIGRSLTDTPILGRLTEGIRSGTFRREAAIDQIPRIFAYAQVADLPFVITVGKAEEEILDAWRQRAWMYGLLLGTLFLSLTILILAWRRSYQRAEQMAARMGAAFEYRSRQGRALLDAIPAPAWLVDRDGRFLAMNEAFATVAGHSREAVIGRTAADLFSPEVAENLRRHQMEVFEAGRPVRTETWLDLNNGHGVVPYEFLRVPVLDRAGQIQGLAGVAWDISQRYETERRQRLITHVFDHSSEAILILAPDTRIVAANTRATEVLAASQETLVQRKLLDFLPEEVRDEVIPRLRRDIATHGFWRGETQGNRITGERFPAHCDISQIRDETGRIANYFAFIADLTEHKAALARMESLRFEDQLTGLPNREGFARTLETWLEEGRSGALLVLDMNQVGRINDAFGYHAGDELLRQFARRLREGVGAGDVVGRLGGDQFAVLAAAARLPGTAQALAARLLGALTQPYRVAGNDLVPGVCIGICLFPEHGSNSVALLRNGDAAMHLVKPRGVSDYQLFSPEINQQAAERLRLESDLRWALPRGELKLHYQPQVDIVTGNTLGFECLVRWQHPELGLISPARFIPLAEESRLILPIGAWVLEEACRQGKRWLDAGHPPVLMAVNLSAEQFHGTDITAEVGGILARSGYPSQWLELEITESVLMQEPERMVLVMDRLKNLGVHLSIDDFGTGYSSLAYLKRFPIDKIKIDRSFIRDVPGNPEDVAIVRMVIAMAAELEHRVIAEGVESEAQLSFLREHQCHEYQGFLCSPPVPAEEASRFLPTRSHPSLQENSAA